MEQIIIQKIVIGVIIVVIFIILISHVHEEDSKNTSPSNDPLKDKDKQE